MIIYLLIFWASYNTALHAMDIRSASATITFKLHKNTNTETLLTALQRLNQIRDSNPFILNPSNVHIDHETKVITVTNVLSSQKEEVRKTLEFLDNDSGEWDPIEHNPWSFGDGTPNNPYPHNPLEEIAGL